MSLCHLNMQINLRMHLLCNLGLFKRIDLVFSLIVGHLGKSSSNRCEGLLWLWFSRIDSIKSPEGQCFYALLLILRSGSPTGLYVGFNGVCQCDNHDRLTPLPSYIFISRGIPSKLFTIKSPGITFRYNLQAHDHQVSSDELKRLTGHMSKFHMTTSDICLPMKIDIYRYTLWISISSCMKLHKFWTACWRLSIQKMSETLNCAKSQ